MELEKGAPYVCIDTFNFPDKETEKKFEDACEQYRKDDPSVIFAGRITRDPMGKYTHILIWKYENFQAHVDNCRAHAARLETSSKPEGDYPGYLCKDWYCYRVVDFNDPYLKKHGVEEWQRYEGAISNNIEYDNPERVVGWHEGFNRIAGRSWPREVLEKTGWWLGKPKGKKPKSS